MVDVLWIYIAWGVYQLIVGEFMMEGPPGDLRGVRRCFGGWWDAVPRALLLQVHMAAGSGAVLGRTRPSGWRELSPQTG